MAAVPPSGSGPQIPSTTSLYESLTRGPQLSVPPSYTSNGTYGRVCTLEKQQRPQQYLSQGETREQEAARKARERKQMNTIGLWMGGVLTAGGAFVRLIGGNEDAVEKAAEMTWTRFSPTPGDPTSLPRRFW